MKILFTNTSDAHPDYSPQPADKFIPEWYRDMESYISGKKDTFGNGKSTSTIKRCMPVFDSFTAGYIIPSHTDIMIKQTKVVEHSNQDSLNLSEIKSNPYYEYRSGDPIEFHEIWQASVHPNRRSHNIAYPKWMNPWAIQTPPGYSTLFIQPLHRESVFTIFSGIVDTDKYTAPVNIPFALNEPDKFEGLIPAGTPMVQVIPFKRDSWEMEFGTNEDLYKSMRVNQKITTKIFDSYKTNFRSKKEYK